MHGEKAPRRSKINKKRTRGNPSSPLENQQKYDEEGLPPPRRSKIMKTKFSRYSLKEEIASLPCMPALVSSPVSSRSNPVVTKRGFPLLAV
jgi:hypothetical protein